MARLFDARRGVMVSTSLKVLYSTLVYHQHLTRIRETTALSLLLRGKVKRHVLFVRNPYDRLVSTWADKFLTHPRTFGQPGFRGWQHVQRLYLRQAGLPAEASDEAIGDALQATSFRDFMTHLPAIYRRDAHLMPQSRTMSLRYKGGFPILPLRFDQIVHIEKMDASALSDEFGIDVVNVRRNATDHPPADALFTPDLRSTVRRLYRRDFETFGYE